MDELSTIPKKPTRRPSQDYELLRQEGLRHIEALSHDLWTDYNSHDPGITILEALCYAITELGYRNDFEIKDLVTRKDTGTTDDKQVFYTAKKILTINPLTINDYRKMLVDIEGIHNAWLMADDSGINEFNTKVPVNEVPLYADFKNDKLSNESTNYPIFLSGLYRVLLDLDNDSKYGDLNTGDIVLSNPSITGFQAGEFMIVFELAPSAEADLIFAEKTADKVTNHISTISVSEYGPQWKCLLTLDDASDLEFGLTVPKKPAGKKINTSDIELLLNDPDFLHDAFDAYQKKINEAKGIVNTALKRLHEKRNLCEDFLSVNTVPGEAISFCFDVDVKPGADIEKVQAEIFHAIENYLNPSVDFYSLRELLDKKVPVEKIFNGPVLEHGFIDTLQLEQTQLRTVIYTSDIINLLMEIEGVLAIRNFVMTKFNEEGKAIQGQIGLSWCMNITPMHKPVLAKEKSKILLFKNQFPFLARYDEVRDTVLLLHTQRAKKKLYGFQQDLEIPIGKRRDSELYWPVQYDFPQNYGIGEHGLPTNATTARKAQQKQLKAYLMFYEQMLADFFSQLSNTYQLFSIADLKQTYYAQFLGDIKDLGPVYKTNGTIPLLKTTIENADSNHEFKNNWQDLYENKQVFQDRRSRFLDHLLARFAESFNEYALLMYRINYEERTEEKISFDEVTTSKIKLLGNYPEISSNRGKAFNYFPQKEDETFTVDPTMLWDTDNVSGLEKRICSLTGIIDDSRRFLYCIKNIEIICREAMVTENGEEILKCLHEFKVTTTTEISLYNSNAYETKEKAQEAVVKLIELASVRENYSYDEASKKLKLLNGDGVLMETLDNSIQSQDEAEAAIEAFIAEFNKNCNDPVGLHLIEHILLRQRNDSFELMEVCLHNGECLCDIDPYTFRASVVLPYWPGHFDNMQFREYFETKIREEAPAHIMLKICWLNNDLMREFEVNYKEWIESVATYTSDKTIDIGAFRDANNKMIDTLSRLKSEYPKATLHDCDESKQTSNTVVLGKTVLETFKSQ